MLPRTALPCLLSAALLAGVAAQAGAPKPILLKEANATGDVTVVETSMGMEMDCKVSRGSESIPFDLSSRENERYRETTLADGFRRTYAVSTAYDKNPEGEKDRVRSLQGKTVAVRKVKGKVVVTADQGKLSAEDRADLVDDLDNPQDRFDVFPPKPVAVGGEWTLDEKTTRNTVAKSMGKGGKAEVWGKLEELTTRDGKPVARISLRLHMERVGPGEPRMSMDLLGEVLHRTDIHRIISADLTGPTTLSGTKDGLKMVGEGTTHMKWLSKPVKVAGKPAP